MTILGLSGAGLILAAGITVTATYALPGADAGAGMTADPAPVVAPAVEPDPAPAPAADPKADLAAKLEQTVTFNFEGLALEDVLMFLRVNTGLVFKVQGGADAPPITLNATDMKLKTVIQWLEAMTKAKIEVALPAAP